MGKIHKLPEDVVSQIAAGEVIERPAFVVKELIENALDAGATHIEIDIEAAGLEKIAVTDNGIGMSKEDLAISFLPHTTSKLQDIEDLHRIKTLGFRGEALASIASVCTLTIESKTENNDSGYKIIINGQSVSEPTPVGKSTGTRITVFNLFSNIPARKKFLKHPLTEIRLITEMVSHYVLANPSVSFRLSHNERTLLDVPSTSFEDRLSLVWGDEFLTNTIPVSLDSSYMSLTGLVGKPQMSASSQGKLWIYVNKRKVVDQLIQSAIREAFGTLLMARSYPTGVLFLTVPPEVIDVNVHPTKREVRFVTPTQIFQEVKDAILTTLSSHNLTYSDNALKGTTQDLQNELRNVVSDSDVFQIGKTHNEEILQIHKSFLVAESKEGFMIVDQHAAHESLLYFEFLKAWESKKSVTKSVALTQSQVIDLTAAEDLLYQEHGEKLTRLGFEIEPFGSRSYQVLKTPPFYSNEQVKAVIKELLEAFSKDIKESLTEKEHHMLATLACKSALKAGETLSQETMRELVSALTEKHYTYTCPHGRPVKIEITLPKLTQMFKR